MREVTSARTRRRPPASLARSPRVPGVSPRDYVLRETPRRRSRYTTVDTVAADRAGEPENERREE